MFTSSELLQIIQSKDFLADYGWVQQALVDRRAEIDVLFQSVTINNLDYFIEATLSSCIDWQFEEGIEICKIAGEIAEILSTHHAFSEIRRRKYRFKAAVLYEHAGLPSLSQASIDTKDYGVLISDFFKRQGGFKKLVGENIVNSFLFETDNIVSFGSPIDSILKEDVFQLLDFEQGGDTKKKIYSVDLGQLAESFQLELNSSEISAFSNVIKRRTELATINNVKEDLFTSLKAIQFPAELWPTQLRALKAGLLNDEYDSWGLASPTGTGKTFLTRLLIVDAVKSNPIGKLLYLVPSRALVYEVSTTLQRALEELDIEVIAVNPQLIELASEEQDDLEDASVVVLTPEKADLLLRISKETFSTITHVIIDEAHHIEADTRGVLLELYLWRIKKLITGKVRFIFLSAVAPNINALTEWIGKNPKSEIVDARATRMRAGVYSIVKNPKTNFLEGWINYHDGTKLKLLENNVDNTTLRRSLIQLIDCIHKTGPILIVTKGKKECEHLSNEIYKWLEKYKKLNPLSENQTDSDEFKRLDSRLEREMYSAVPLRKLIPYRIAYHHAGLPPRVRTALEDAIREGMIDYVFATTTLAEGVNFPFSTVVVQSLALKEAPQPGISPVYRPITPRSFWNIAGRAGRPGYDKEGQVILFEPSLGLEKINAVIKSYLNPNLKDIEPVKSALSESIVELQNELKKGSITLEELNNIELDEKLSKRVKGTINLLRIGLVHAKAAEILESPEDILENSFANFFLTSEQKEFGNQLIAEQSMLLSRFFQSQGAPSEKLVAEIGLSLDTVERLKNFVLKLENWQIESYHSLFYGGNLNLNNVGFIIGPVAKNIAELEGDKLGGYLSELIIKWLAGIPLVVIRSELNSPFSKRLKNSRLEDLIAIIYSRIQYLLPWGLFAVDSIIAEEAKRRNIDYNNEVRRLAYLADVGVPSYDAHRLVNCDFERVDATRLYKLYDSLGGINLGVDIVGWLINENIEVIKTCVRGFDNRRIDYDLDDIINGLKDSIKKQS